MAPSPLSVTGPCIRTPVGVLVRPLQIGRAPASCLLTSPVAPSGACPASRVGTGCSRSKIVQDVQARPAGRPIYHHQRDSIEAHLTIVFAALAVSRWIEQATGWSIRKFVRTARRYRTVEIQAGAHTITAADPLPDDLRDALDRIHGRSGAH
jgi:hypothetical protein